MATCNQCDQGCEHETRKECFACGLPVCVKCSQKLPYLRYGLKRLCHNCMSEHGFEAEVMLDIYRHNGYAQVTLEWCKAVIACAVPYLTYPPEDKKDIEDSIVQMQYAKELADTKRALIIQKAYEEDKVRLGRALARTKKEAISQGYL